MSIKNQFKAFLENAHQYKITRLELHDLKDSQRAQEYPNPSTIADWRLKNTSF